MLIKRVQDVGIPSFMLFMKNKWWLTSRTTQNTTSKHKNFNIIPLIYREIDSFKTRFQLAKKQKIPIFHDVGIQNFEVIYKNKWWLISRTTQNTISKHKNFTIFPLSLRQIDVEKTRIQPAKTQEMTYFFMTLEFKILRLFMKKKWWLTFRTPQNTTSKNKNFNIFPLILRKIDAE
jgi:hypothetical protein